MLKFRKSMAFVVAFAFIFSMMTTAFAAPKTADEIAASKYQEAIETLKGLNIMVGDDDGNFRPNDPIKRTELTKIAVILLGLEEIANASKGETQFPDIPADHWSTGFVNTGVNQGIIIGDDNGNFRPDDNIIYADVITVLVRALGYEPYALSKGGYPQGYIAAANYNGLTKNAASDTMKPVSRGVVAQLAFNALTIKLMEQVGFGENASYEVVDKTILENNLEYKKIQGLVSATDETSLTGAQGLSKNQIKIGDTVYKTEDSKAASHLGYAVTAYAKVEENGNNVTLIRRDDSKNNAVTVLASNMEKVNGTTVEYYQNRDTDSKTKTLKLSDDAAFILNGKQDAISEFKLPFDGSVTFVDNNQDNKFDVIHFSSIRNVVVDDIAEGSFRVMDKYGNKGLTLDPENEDVKFSITDKEGNALSLSDLSEWNVISVAESKDGSIVKGIVSTESVEGAITSVKGDKYVIGGKTYGVAANYTGTLSLRDEGIFYLDAQGDIAAVDGDVTMKKSYAFLEDAGQTGSLEKKTQFRLFTSEGKTEVVQAADKVKFNGTSTPAEDVLAALQSGGKVTKQLVSFETNKDGQVTALSTAEDKSGEGLSYNKGKFTLSYANSDATFRAASSKLDKIVINENTIVFDIPSSASSTTDYAVRDKKFFSDNTNYDVKVYDLAEDLSASVVVVTSSAGSTTAESPIAVVKDVLTSENSEGEEVETLEAIYNGKEISINTSEKGILVNEEGEALVEGDVIQFRQNTKGEIDKVKVLLSVSDKETEKTDSSVKDLVTVYGKVEKKFTTSMNVSVNNADVENFSFDGAKIYVVDTNKPRNKVSIGDAGDIAKFDEQDPSRVFLKIYKDVVQEVVVVK